MIDLFPRKPAVSTEQLQQVKDWQVIDEKSAA